MSLRVPGPYAAALAHLNLDRTERSWQREKTYTGNSCTSFEDFLFGQTVFLFSFFLGGGAVRERRKVDLGLL